MYCIARGDTGVTPYWTGVEECDVYEGDVALPRLGPMSLLTVLFVHPDRTNR